jgi:DNA repair protein RecO (recombination protein O)
MSLVTTPALVLHTFPYGETSKIARLLTLHHGVQSVIAKGALRPKSKFGARLQVLSEGTAQMYLKANRALHTLAEFEVTSLRPELAREVARYAAGAALAELIMRSAPAEPHPEIYECAVAGLELLVHVPSEQLDSAALAVLWAAIGALGFAPSLDACARDGSELPDGRIAFSVSDGGFLCKACARDGATTRLDASDRAALERLVAATGEPVGELSARHAEAHRRLLQRFVERHLAEGRELKALTFWQELA